MQSTISHLVSQHDYRILLAAVVVCVLGSIVTMRVFARARRTEGANRIHWLFLSGVVGGSTIWSTRIIATVGYSPAVMRTFDPANTVLSLFLAIAITSIGLYMAAMTRRSAVIELGGMIIGLGIAAMYYSGFESILINGRVEWNLWVITPALVLCTGFGAISMNRIARPVTRFCKYGGASAMVLSIVSIHIGAIAAASIVPDPTLVISEHGLPDNAMTLTIVAFAVLVLGLAVSTYFFDQRQRTETSERFRELKHHDALTGIPNHVYLSERLGDTLTQALDDTASIAVLSVHLDRLKEINDVHGPATGNQVLSAIVERLSGILSDDDFLATTRSGELVIVRQRIYAAGQVTGFTDRVATLIRQDVNIAEQALSVDMSCGVTLFPDDGTNPEELLGQADLAMRRAMQSPAKRVYRYDPSVDEGKRTRSALAIELGDAIERGELELFYQPQHDVASGERVGFEALVRWNHRERGLVSPADFIPIAEETGLIVPIGEWVLKTACEEAAKWAQPMRVAVNVAPMQFSHSDLPAIVLDTLVKTGLPASRLELEITESSIFEDRQHALHIVRQLKAIGIKIAMDDYGTGYSSLSMLHSFPFDKIKIDRSFITGVTENEQSAAIVKATIILADTLDIPVLAEGVETDADMAFLEAVGCREAQGYLLGKPAPAGAYPELIETAAEQVTTATKTTQPIVSKDGKPITPEANERPSEDARKIA